MLLCILITVALPIAFSSLSAGPSFGSEGWEVLLSPYRKHWIVFHFLMTLYKKH